MNRVWKRKKELLEKDISKMNDRELAKHAGITDQHFLYLKQLVGNKRISKKGITSMTKYIKDYIKSIKKSRKGSRRTRKDQKARSTNSTTSLVTYSVSFGRPKRPLRIRKKSRR
jgi:hypothetical protein